MKENQNFTYIAFISYKREDEKWAQWIQDRLESYKLPATIGEEKIEYLRPVFRDITDLRPGLLSERIKESLDTSKYLIAICSPLYSKSIWCEKEIKRFIETGKTRQIIPLIVDGTPYSNDEECFPPSLRSLRGTENELLGIDVRQISKDYAFVQIVASILDLNVDTLWKRHLRKEEEEKIRIKEENERLLKLQSIFTCEKAKKLVDEWPFDKIKATRIALEVVPKDSDHQERPWTPQAEYLLRSGIQTKVKKLIIKETGVIAHVSKHYYIYTKDKSDHNAKDTSIRIYNTKGIHVETLDYGYPVSNICVSSDGQFVCLNIKDQIIVHYLLKNIEDNVCRNISKHTDKLKISPDNRLIAAINHNEITIVNIEKSSVTSYKGHESKIRSIEFSPNSKMIATTGLDKKTIIWNSSNHKEIITFSHESEFIPNYASFSDDNKSIVVSLDIKKTNFSERNRGVVIAYDIKEGQELWRVSPNVTYSYDHLYYSDNLSYIIGWESDCIIFYDLETGQKVNDICCANFHLDKKRKQLITVQNSTNEESTIFVHKLSNRKELLKDALKEFGNVELTEDEKKDFFLI